MKILFWFFTISILFISCGGAKDKSILNTSDSSTVSNKTNANTINDSLGYWKINNYFDEFDEKIDKQYISLRSDLGIFSTPGTTSSELDVIIVADKAHSEIQLFKHGGDYQTKLEGYIDFKVKESNGDIYDIKTFEGCTFEENTHTTDSLFKAVLSRGGEIKFAAMVKEYGNETKFNFTIPNADHFQYALALIKE